jgi:serine O-acetyltransferase
MGDAVVTEPGGKRTRAADSTTELVHLRQDLALDRPVRAWLPELMTVRAIATILFRLSQACGRRAPHLAYFIKQVNHIVTGADVAWQATVGPGLTLYHPTGVVIGPDVVVGARCVLQQGVTLGASRERGRIVDGRVDSPVLGDGVEIGAGARILGPISVGDGSVVGANAVVLKDVPPGHLAVGVPARVTPRAAGL